MSRSIFVATSISIVFLFVACGSKKNLTEKTSEQTSLRVGMTVDEEVVAMDTTAVEMVVDRLLEKMSDETIDSIEWERGDRDCVTKIRIYGIKRHNEVGERLAKRGEVMRKATMTGGRKTVIDSCRVENKQMENTTKQSRRNHWRILIVSTLALGVLAYFLIYENRQRGGRSL